MLFPSTKVPGSIACFLLGYATLVSAVGLDSPVLSGASLQEAEGHWQSSIQKRGEGIPPPDADGKYTLEAEGIRASFIPYGASVTNLWVKGGDGVERDIVLGFDNATYYEVDTKHDHMGGVVGRYANRIKNSTFEIDGVKYDVLPNDHNNTNQLHGGPHGWDWRNFTVTSLTNTSITFSLLDPDGSQGFPGAVISHITYTLSPHTWHIRMTALALTKKTPIMLSSHVYWNLDGYGNAKDETALNHVLYMPKARRRVGVDGNLIPTGQILRNKKAGVNDFWSKPKRIGTDLPRSLGNCGTDCSGYDNAYIHDPFRPMQQSIATLSSPWSNITLDVFTNQASMQMYSCNFQTGAMPYKKTQGPPKSAASASARVVGKHACVVLEVQDWIDGVNHPEWRRLGMKNQIYGPKRGVYELEARYVFGVAGAGAGSGGRRRISAGN